MPPLAIVFDLDGTLVDTAPDLLDSLNHIITRDGLSPVDTNALRAHVGHGGRAMLKRAHAAQDSHPDEVELDAQLAAFVEHYKAGMPGRSRPFDGVIACLDRFEAAGYRLGVCTNKHEALSRSLLDALMLSNRFGAICGGDTFAVRKPHPEQSTRSPAIAGAP